MGTFFRSTNTIVLIAAVAALSACSKRQWQYGSPGPLPVELQKLQPGYKPPTPPDSKDPVTVRPSPVPEPSPEPSAAPPNQRLSTVAQVTILGTNDIHGGIEASETQSGAQMGGLAFYAGVVKAIREGVAKKAGEDGGVLVVDAGDQFQGTLLSNFDEGKLMYDSMSEVGYDAVVPGNHDYDFGPVGWTVDQVPADDEASLRGALRETIKHAKFPLLSANTFLKSSIVDADGQPVKVDGNYCAPALSPPQLPIDWSKAQTLDFLKPYVIKQVAGIRVAIVALDNPTTPKVTTPHNVKDLCFADEAYSYLRVRRQLEGQADVFVIVIHNGNINTDMYATKLVDKVMSADRVGDGANVDAVIAGHTHQVNNLSVRGVPIIQSGANGKLFGRVDLFFDRTTRQVDQSKTKRLAGIQLLHNGCSGEAQGTCTASDGKVFYEGVEAVPSEKILGFIKQRRAEIAPLAARKLGTAQDTVDNRGPNGESAMGNQLTDFLRAVSGSEVAFMNTGGIRTSFNPRGLPNTDILYEDLFRVLPFSNHGVVLGPMKIEGVLSILMRNARQCSGDGGMAWSGLRVQIARKCKNDQGQTVPQDPEAILMRVETVGGELVIENGKAVDPGRTFQVATLDFLQAGGSGYTQFADVPLIKDLGIVRDVIADLLADHPVAFSSQVDGRVKVTERQVTKPQP